MDSLKLEKSGLQDSHLHLVADLVCFCVRNTCETFVSLYHIARNSVVAN